MVTLQSTSIKITLLGFIWKWVGLSGRWFAIFFAESEIYCQFIEDMILQKDNYYKLAISTYNEYTERLNWSSSGNKVYQLIKEIM